jgi:arylformamidase
MGWIDVSLGFGRGMAVGSHAGTRAAALDLMIGAARVACARGGVLDAPALCALMPARGERLLLAFTLDARLTRDGAAYLAECGVAAIGLESLCAGALGEEGDVHRILAEANVGLIEGLDLRGVTPGDYELVCLPLLVHGAEGAPARAALRKITPAAASYR